MLEDYRNIAKKIISIPIENIIFKRIKTISWIKYEYNNTIQKLIFMY
jgi:hypothetical protein